MPLLLLDLDNTLIDRAAAFREWAEAFNDVHGALPSEVDWLILSDRDGLEHRRRFALMIAERFGLGGAGAAAVHQDLLLGMVDHVRVDPAVLQELDRARKAGWKPLVITNGTACQQERKLERTALGEHLDAWVISETAGVAKPDSRIFHLAAAQAGLPVDGAWMIGDSAEADIGGAHRLGLSSVWLSRSRKWSIASFEPTITAKNCVDAINAVISSGK